MSTTPSGSCRPLYPVDVHVFMHEAVVLTQRLADESFQCDPRACAASPLPPRAADQGACDFHRPPQFHYQMAGWRSKIVHVLVRQDFIGTSR